MRAGRVVRPVVIGLLVVLCLGPTTQAVEAADPFSEIDAYVEEQLDDSRIPGAAIAIVQDGELVHARGFGDDDGAAITSQTPFPIGSLTKSFTALAVMQLVEAGRIDLDAPVQRYIPWFAVADAEASARITVRMLLNQTSGLSRATGITPLVEEWDGTSEEYVRNLRSAELNRPAGESYEYSNANFVTLGLLVETVSGQPYGDYVQQHIFTPLEMTNSYTSHEAAREAGMVSLHRYWFGVARETTSPNLPGQVPAGFLVSTADDMANYLMMYLNDGTFAGRQLLSSEGIATLLAPATNATSPTLLGTTFDARYGMGWFVGPFGAEQDSRWHMGELPMFNAWMVMMPDSDKAVVVLVNANSGLPVPGASEVFSRIPIGVTNLLAGEDAPTGMSLARAYLIFDIAVVIIVALQLAALARLVLRPRPTLQGRARRLRFTLPLLWELGLSVLILLGLPSLLGVGWRATFNAMPDFALVLMVVAILWIVTGLVRTGMLVAPTVRQQAALRTTPRGEIGAPAT